MTRRARVVIAVTALMLLSSAVAFADGWGGPGGHRGGGGGFGWPVLRAVGLSDEQKAHIRQIYAAHRPQLQALGQQIHAAPAARRQAVQRGPAIDGRPGVDQPAPRSD